MTIEMSRMPPSAKRCRANQRFFPGGAIPCSASSGGVVSGVAVLFVTCIVLFPFRLYSVTLRSLEKDIRLKGILLSMCQLCGLSILFHFFGASMPFVSIKLESIDNIPMYNHR